MKIIRLFKFTTRPFASVIIASVAWASSGQHHWHAGKGLRHVELIQPSTNQDTSNDGPWYKPPRSPGFHDLTGS
jgi:hypothetical protein